MIMVFCKRFLGVAVCACLLVGATNAGAGTVYNNLPPYSTDGADGVSGAQLGPLADSFSTGAGGFILNDVMLNLQVQGAVSPTGTATVELLNDSSTSPGTLKSVLGIVTDAQVFLNAGSTFNPAVYDIPVAPISLAANTRYWIELVADSGQTTNIFWTWSLDTSGPGVASEFLSNQNGIFANPSNGPYQMGVFGDSAIVPEPASVVLLGLGWIGFHSLPPRRVRGTDSG